MSNPNLPEAVQVVDFGRGEDHWLRRRRFRCVAGHLHYSEVRAERCTDPPASDENAKGGSGEEVSP